MFIATILCLIYLKYGDTAKENMTMKKLYDKIPASVWKHIRYIL
ncbi:Hha/YmoA family nucleoid-associated regulatory protein [Enterobacter huaxiensis]